MTDPLRAALEDLFPAVQRARWPFTVEQAATALRAALAADAARPEVPATTSNPVQVARPARMTDPLRAALEDFMGWLFRDGGLEPPRREYDDVEQRLRGLLIAVAADTARPGLDVEALARALEPFTRSVLHDDIGKWRRETAAKIVTEYARLTEERP